MFKSIFMGLKKIFFKKTSSEEVEEEKKSNLDEDFLQLLTIISESSSLFNSEFISKYDYDKHRYHTYLKLINKNNADQIIYFFVGHSEDKKDYLNTRDIFSEFFSKNPSFSFKKLILPKELKDKLFDAYLYKYTEKAKINQLKTDLLFGLSKNND